MVNNLVSFDASKSSILQVDRFALFGSFEVFLRLGEMISTGNVLKFEISKERDFFYQMLMCPFEMLSSISEILFK